MVGHPGSRSKNPLQGERVRSGSTPIGLGTRRHQTIDPLGGERGVFARPLPRFAQVTLHGIKSNGVQDDSCVYRGIGYPEVDPRVTATVSWDCWR